MKKVTLLALFSLITLGVRADLSEDFNSLSSGTWSTETNVDLPSGTWTFGGDAQRNSSNSVVSIKFNSAGAYMISPAIESSNTDPAVVARKWRLLTRSVPMHGK